MEKSTIGHETVTEQEMTDAEEAFFEFEMANGKLEEEDIYRVDGKEG